MQHKNGRVVGAMTYREGDGVQITIPPGPCKIVIADIDVTLSWVDGETRGSAAIPMGEYSHYVADGILVVE